MMEIYITYILFSEQIGGYYIGSTSKLLIDRLSRHNTKHKGYTSRANDWKVIFSKELTSISEARELEIEIKKRGASRYLDDLKKQKG
ncbi:MAG: GIY-YIG nuclease family protein [Deltaproteobacteria bacterium]